MYKFTDEDKVSSNFWKLKNVGDSIQGTLTRKYKKDNPLDGKEQWIYELKTEGGEFWNVGGKPGIDAQMFNIKLGQIVEFRYIEERPSKKVGKDPAKIVQVFSNRNAVDKEWLEEHEAENHGEGGEEDENSGNADDEIKVDKIPFGDTPEEKNAKIIALAMSKLKVTDLTKVIEVVQEKTGLAFIGSNLDKIIAALELL
jgi:hypothetical protein